MIRTVAFWAAIAGYVWLAILIVAGGAAYPGYSHIRQYISELGADGAPNGVLVSLAGFAPVGLCLMLFAVLAAVLPPRGALRLIGFAGLFAFGASYLGAAFFRCDLGCPADSTSASQLIHSLFGLAGYLGAPIGLVLLAICARHWPRGRALFPLGLACGAIAAAAFLAMLTGAPGGLAQRVLEGAVGVWILACAFTLRQPRPAP